MKKVIIAFATLALVLVSCNGGRQNSYQVMRSPDGRDSVVYVNYNDGNQFVSFYMDYLIFRTLFGNSGYGGCYNYYNTHHYYSGMNTNYSKYTPITGGGYSSPSTRSYSSPSRNASSPTRSYSSPSRSSSSPSYSSPSRSYSSPSRSYSSPSRSYSSPSRSSHR